MAAANALHYVDVPEGTFVSLRTLTWLHRRTTTMPIYNLTAHNGGRLEDDGGTELPKTA
jgi:hypothetical protein